jgi:hypothetical protein
MEIFYFIVAISGQLHLIPVWDELCLILSSIIGSDDTSLKDSVLSLAEKMRVVEEQNVALRSQVQELVEQKLRRDSQLDDFSEALDSRVEEWKVGVTSR